MIGKKRIVIIGNGAAGLTALEAFRRRDRDSSVVLIDRESVPAYSRVITPYYIMGALKKEENLFLRTEGFYRQRGVRALFGRTVEAIDTRARFVVLDRGEREPFDLLLIATGASPNHPDMKGAAPGDLLVLRDLAHARRLKEIRERGGEGLFLGAGLVSLQTLQAMHKTGSRPTLVVKSDRILSQTLDFEGAALVETRLEKMGVRVMKEREVLYLEKGATVVLDKGERVLADFVFAGKGIRPNTGFLQESGVEARSGILVDRHLETSIEGIYAAGDVARAPDFFSGEQVNYGLWPSAVEQGEIAGKNLAGAKEAYSGNLRMNVSRIFAIPLASIGDIGSERVKEAWVVKDEKQGTYRKLCLNEKGILVGAVLINRMEDVGVIQGFIRTRRETGFLMAHSAWKSSVSYGMVYQGIRTGMSPNNRNL